MTFLGRFISVATALASLAVVPGAVSPTARDTAATATRLVPEGKEVATAKGTLQGDASRDFAIHAGAGQLLAVELRVSNPSAYFNLLPPGSSDVAMFIGSTSGDSVRVTAPIAGDYVARVYLMRSAARRSATSTFTLTARVTGRALEPLSPGQDPVLPGTPFHARAPVRCDLPYQPDVHECEASVIRCDHAGSATVELRGPNGFVRRILFVKGTPKATDAAQPISSSRAGDATTVRIGTEERFVLPDALISGG